jgi:hypothetical protein
MRVKEQDAAGRGGTAGNDEECEERVEDGRGETAIKK